MIVSRPGRLFPGILLLTGLLMTPVDAQERGSAPTARPPRPGVAAPEVRRSVEDIRPDAVFTIEGVPDWQVVTGDAVWVSNGPRGTLHRLDPATNAVAATIEVGGRPCSGLAAGFGSVWVPNCADGTLVRVDIETNTVVATLPVGPAATEGGIAAGKDSVWILSDAAGVLSRIDPATNTIVAEIPVPPESFALVAGEDGAIWITSNGNDLLVRVDPATNLITDRIDVGDGPRFLAAGAGAIWTLNQGDGTVTRVDITSKLGQTIDLGAPGGGGEIAYGEDFVWVTVFEIPLTQIDPRTNKVTKQWFGAGGDAVRVGHGSVWLSNLRQENVWRVDPRQF